MPAGLKVRVHQDDGNPRALVRADTEEITRATQQLSRAGLAVSLYNLLLCTVPKPCGPMPGKASPAGRTTTWTRAQAARPRHDAAASSAGSPPSGPAAPCTPSRSKWHIQHVDRRRRSPGCAWRRAAQTCRRPLGLGPGRRQVRHGAQLGTQSRSVEPLPRLLSRGCPFVSRGKVGAGHWLGSGHACSPCRKRSCR